MITPVVINRLQWKAYLIFICTNLAFIPLVYFCYPEMANLMLEEIDYLFTNPDKCAVRLSRELYKERKRGTHQQSFVQSFVQVAEPAQQQQSLCLLRWRKAARAGWLSGMRRYELVRQGAQSTETITEGWYPTNGATGLFVRQYIHLPQWNTCWSY